MLTGDDESNKIKWVKKINPILNQIAYQIEGEKDTKIILKRTSD